MVRTTLKTVVASLSLFAIGCAPWARGPATEYVTVAGDGEATSAETRKLYDKARKEMAKHQCGEKCDLAAAEKMLQEALACDVRFGPAHHSLGVLYFWQNKLYLSAWEFEYAAKLMPDRFESLNNLGLVYESAGKYDQAKMYYSLARQKAELEPHVISNQARLAMRDGQTVDQIRPLLEDVIATDPRPEWKYWAREQLGLHPESKCPEFCELPANAIQDGSIGPSFSAPTPAEELPHIAPPMPSSTPSTGASDQSVRRSFELKPSLELDLGQAFREELSRR